MSEAVPAPISAERVSLPADHPLARRLPRAGLVVGVLGLGLSAMFAGGAPARFFHAYLVAYVFGLTLALGGLFFVLLHHTCRAGWSTAVRRLAEHVAGTLPLFALLFVPLAFGLEELYPWARPEAANDPLLAAKAGWLNPGFFYLRAAIYLAIWSLLGWWFRQRSLAQDASGDPAITRRLQTLSAPAMVVFGVTLTFAGFDWVMSLDPWWYSTIFGVYLFAGSVVAIFALLALLATALRRPLDGVVSAEHLHDIGKLLFGFVVFWAYIAFSQFMLIWYGNIPEETLWYAHRLEHGWQPVSVALAVGHFVVPFFFLLPRDVKRRPATLAAGAAWLLVMHYLDLYWLVMPALADDGFGLHPLDLLTLAGVLGLFVAALGLLMRRPALVPLRDPRLAESMSFENL